MRGAHVCMEISTGRGIKNRCQQSVLDRGAFFVNLDVNRPDMLIGRHLIAPYR
jgi:hypothetical protein